MKAPPFTLTNESISVIWNGKSHTVKAGTPNFVNLRKAILNEDWNSIEANLSPAMSIHKWAKGLFSVRDDIVYRGSTALPEKLSARILEMASQGNDPTTLLNFWERLQKNPSMRSVTQLFSFLENVGIPFTPSGCFLAYKSVRQDYLDHHSGTYDNSPGTVHIMPRNQISDDPNFACHQGFHVGALEYASTFQSGGRIMICKVDPADVVCVPYDASSQKMRVCRYEVIGEHSGAHMSSTVEDDEVIASHDQADYEEDSDPLDIEYDMNGLEDPYSEPEIKSKVKKGKVTKRKVVNANASPLDKMSQKELLDQSMELLRSYASRNLKIVGASKIPGGKVALVSAIIKTRR